MIAVKRFGLLIFMLVASMKLHAHLQLIVTPGNGNKSAHAWQGNTNTVINAFASNTIIPDGLLLYIWNAQAQTYDIVSYDFGEWSHPNYQIKPAQGFIVASPDYVELTMTGPDLSGPSITLQLAKDKWTFVGHAYPREGWLEKSPRPYTASCYLNFPGRNKAGNGGVEDEYYRWDETSQLFVFTRRADDNSYNDPDNPTGGYGNTNQFGARWRPPGETTGYQGNGFALNWLHLGEPIFVKPRTNKTWVMYLANDPLATCP
jgi:hypothetical protein